MGFQCNERYLQWDQSAQRQLILIWVAQQLSITLPQLDERLAELSLLLPTLVAKLDRLEAGLVLHLVADLPAVTQRILDLRQLLPSLDLSALLADSPWLLTQAPELVQQQLAGLADALPPSVDIERLVAAEPMLLRADIQAVLADLRRLMPGQDPVAVLLSNPSGCLDMAVSWVGVARQHLSQSQQLHHAWLCPNTVCQGALQQMELKVACGGLLHAGGGLESEPGD